MGRPTVTVKLRVFSSPHSLATMKAVKIAFYEMELLPGYLPWLVVLRGKGVIIKGEKLCYLSSSINSKQGKCDACAQSIQSGAYRAGSPSLAFLRALPGLCVDVSRYPYIGACD